MMRFLLPRALVTSVVAGVLMLGVAGAAMAQAVPATSASAATPPSAAPASPYSAIVPVAGTSDAQRNTAIATALSEVLQQISPGFAASPDVLGEASSYVRDFHYRRAASGNGLELQVDFDPGAIGHLIEAGQAAAATAAATGGTPTAAGTAPAVAQGGSGNLWVDGIDNSHAFVSLLSTLRGDNQLHDVTPVAAQGDGVMLHLSFDQPLATVLASLTGPGGHLAAEAQPHQGAAASLRWVP